MPGKRAFSDTTIDQTRSRPSKRHRHNENPDFLSPLSDELLIRILTCLPLSHLLNVAPVSKRFHRLSEDSQIWKGLYYSRFVLPRAMRIPGFRDGSARAGKLHYSSRRAVWADGRRGGWVDMYNEDGRKDRRDWKRQYRLRHNWSKGKCAVEELRIGDPDSEVEPTASPNMLVKVCDGIAITADAKSGIRAWDLKTRKIMAHIDPSDGHTTVPPSALAIDEQGLSQKVVDVAVGFDDGSFGVWRLLIEDRRLVPRYRHQQSSNGRLLSMALLYPFLLTATESVLVSLYTFDGPNISGSGRGNGGRSCESEPVSRSTEETQMRIWNATTTRQDIQLPAPYLLTSLESRTSREPIALSIRKSAGATIASIAYTFSTLRGWCLGIQDLHIKTSISSSKETSDISTTRLAYTLPLDGDAPSESPLPSPIRHATASRTNITQGSHQGGPLSICYTHPYLLATLPDNTLILYLCTSNSSSLTLSPGIRLWGHTSGISDAEITARGKAVSVSSRGEEIRVWELEGRIDGKSVEVRPSMPGAHNSESIDTAQEGVDVCFDERRNWVGFDDEMVIVLKETNGSESLMVYDFT